MEEIDFLINLLNKKEERKKNNKSGWGGINVEIPLINLRGKQIVSSRDDSTNKENIEKLHSKDLTDKIKLTKLPRLNELKGDLLISGQTYPLYIKNKNTNKVSK